MTSYDNEKTAGTSHVEHFQEHEPSMSIGRYLATRIPTLKPPMTKVANPISLLATLNRSQWLFFLVGRTLSNGVMLYTPLTDVSIGWLSRLDMGCFRLFLGQLDFNAPGCSIQQVHERYQLGYHHDAYAAFSRLHHLWSRCG